jgi:hypothetical protein
MGQVCAPPDGACITRFTFTPSNTPTLTPTGTRTILQTPTPTPPPPCPGDCNGDGFVTVDELVLVTNIALGLQSIDLCPSLDGDMDGIVTIDEVVRAVSAAINGCG